MKHYLFYFCVVFLLISCNNNSQSAQSENSLIGDSNNMDNSVVQEIVEPKNSIVGSWKSKTYNGEKFEALTYKINADSTLEDANSTTGYWSMNGDQFCEKYAKKETCFTISIDGDTMSLTNKIGGIFVFVRSDN